MYKKYKCVPTIEESVNVLRKDGVFIVENFLNPSDLKILHDEVKDLCISKGGHYEFGRNYRGDSLESHRDKRTLYKYYSSDWISKLTESFTGKRYLKDSVFATYDYLSDRGIARNGFLHFDRLHCLKFFVYLVDVDEKNGAFTCCVGSNSKGRELRENSWDNSSGYDQVKNRPGIDFPDIAALYPETPVKEKAGSLIVFDTDTFHRGGLVNPGEERLVVRLHKYTNR